MPKKEGAGGKPQEYDADNGQYGDGTSSDAKSKQGTDSESKPKAQSTENFGGKKSKEFSEAVKKAKATVSPNRAWRVTVHTQEELDEYYPGAKLHVTDGGSTVAVTKDGDIISVCKHIGDSMSGKDVLALAVKNGGKKLDSYSGNHGFYTKCGFEPVSWCEWDDAYAPSDWKEDRNKKEPIIFYKYTGKYSGESDKEFFDRVPASKDYDAAAAARDKAIEEDDKK